MQQVKRKLVAVLDSPFKQPWLVAGLNVAAGFPLLAIASVITTPETYKILQAACSLLG